MCGITGWVDWERNLTGQRDAVEAMTATMGCRGPDEEGLWRSPHALIGHRRLAVIDLPGGKQPMVDRHLVLTFSGEIYNFTDLRQELVGYGHRFTTRSDTEVLLRAWQQWGADCLPRLNGMFAFALWDGTRRELFLARDRLGIKPLCYARLGDGVIFGSEPKAVLAHPGFRAELDSDGIAELFAPAATGVPGTPGGCLFRGVAEVKPGSVLRIGRDDTHTTVYWRLHALPHTDDEATTVATVRELLTDAVRRQLVADVPLCTLLSGGLDSSALTAMAAAELRHDGAGKVATFSVDFPGSQENFRPSPLRPSHDEPYARRVAEHLDTRHTTIMLNAVDLTASQAVALHATDRPAMGDMYTSMYLMFQEVRRHATVALSGESADELFAGYGFFHTEAMIAAQAFPWATGGSWSRLLRHDVDAQVHLDERTAARYADARAEVPHLPGEQGRDRRLREILYHGLTRWLPQMLDRKDRLSMAVGLEVRVPFCDHRLVDYVWNVPYHLKQLGGVEKGLLRAAVADLLPPDIVARRKSIYPANVDPAYGQAIQEQIRRLLAQPQAPLFTLVDHARLATEFTADPTLPGLMGVQPGPWAPAAFLLDINRWLSDYEISPV